jgi:hypothetical protein
LPHLTEDEVKIEREAGAVAAPSTPRCSSTFAKLEEKETDSTREAPTFVAVLRLRLAPCVVSKGATAVVGEQGVQPASWRMRGEISAARAPRHRSGEISTVGALCHRCLLQEESMGCASVVGRPRKRALSRRDKEERRHGASSLGGVTASKSSQKRIIGER